MFWPTSNLVGPINSICQLNGGPGALSGALSGASRPFKMFSKRNGICPVESCVHNPLLPWVRCREGARDRKWISFADVMQWSHITAFKMDESVIASHKPNNWQSEREIFIITPPPIIKEYQEHISSAEMLTLSQLAGISYHRAIDWTQCTILRDQSHGPSTVLKNTMFTEEPGPMKHCNTIKYESTKRNIAYF